MSLLPFFLLLCRRRGLLGERVNDFTQCGEGLVDLGPLLDETGDGGRGEEGGRGESCVREVQREIENGERDD